MGAVRRISAASWTRVNAPKSVTRPSWIGGRPVVPPTATRASQSVRPPKAPDADRPAVDVHVAAPSCPPASTALGVVRASVAPQIQTTREVELEGGLDVLRSELARLAMQLATMRARVLEESEPEIVRLALAVAARVVGRELAADPSAMLGWIKEGLAALPGRDEVVVAVAADIAAALPTEEIAAAASTNRIVVDAALPYGTCELREGASTVTVSAEARFAALSDALGMAGER